MNNWYRRLGPVLTGSLVMAFAFATPLQPWSAAEALAQDSEGDGDSEDGGLELQFEQAMDMSDDDKKSKASGLLADERAVLKRVLSILEDARADKDIVKMNCVNEKLTAVKGLLRISEQANVSLQEATAKGESETAAHEFTKLAIAKQKVTQLRAEAEGCVGAEAQYAGDTDVEVETDNNIELLPDQTKVEVPPSPPGSPTDSNPETGSPGGSDPPPTATEGQRPESVSPVVGDEAGGG